jgi:polyhydroxybutyrate depolymerase
MAARKNTKRTFFYAIAALICLIGAAVVAVSIGLPVSEPGHTAHSLVFGGRVRTYLLHLPKTYDVQSALPLVIVLHGGGDYAGHAITSTAMSAKADEKQFVVVYPNGTGRLKNRLLTWNAGTGDGYASRNNIDDVGFIRALIDSLRTQYKIDANRLYVTGLSNGGMMAYRLACELPDIAAIAPVAGTQNYEPCRPSHPVSVIAFHGTADETVPFDGGAPRRRMFYLFKSERIDRPVSDTVSFWKKEDGCESVAAVEPVANIIREACTGGTNRTEVVLYAIKGAGHVWPGGPRLWRFGDDPISTISATDIIWEFFSTHPKTTP